MARGNNPSPIRRSALPRLNTDTTDTKGVADTETKHRPVRYLNYRLISLSLRPFQLMRRKSSTDAPERTASLPDFNRRHTDTSRASDKVALLGHTNNIETNKCEKDHDKQLEERRGGSPESISEELSEESIQPLTESLTSYDYCNSLDDLQHEPELLPVKSSDTLKEPPATEPSDTSQYPPQAESFDVPEELPTAEPFDSSSEPPASKPLDTSEESHLAEPSDITHETPAAEPPGTPQKPPQADPLDIPKEPPPVAPSDTPPAESFVTPIKPPTAESDREPRESQLQQRHSIIPEDSKPALPEQPAIPVKQTSTRTGDPSIELSPQSGDVSKELSTVVSGVSSPSRAARPYMRSFPPTVPPSEPQSDASDSQPPPKSSHFHASSNQDQDQGAAFSMLSDRVSVISAQWSDLYDQRRRIKRCREELVSSVSWLTNVRYKKKKADNAFRRMALLYSETSQLLPTGRLTRLLNHIETLEGDCAAAEAQIEQLGEELRRREAKLEFSEMTFYQHMSSSSRPATHPEHVSKPFLESFGVKSASRRELHPHVQHQHPKQRLHRTLHDELLLGVVGERPSDKHPLYSLLLNANKELDAAKEKRKRLQQERDHIISYWRARAERSQDRSSDAESDSELDLGLEDTSSDDETHQLEWCSSAYSAYQDSVDVDFLKHYENFVASAETKILERERYVQRLRDTCSKQALFPKGSLSEDESSGVNRMQDFVLEPSSKGGATTASDISSFPILLSNPLFLLKQYPLTAREAVQKMLAMPEDHPQRQGLIDDSIKEYGIISSLMRSSSGSKFEFVNRWILQQLRMSPMNAILLYATFSGILSILNLDQWQKDVLHFWARDGTNLPDYFFHGSVNPSITMTESSSQALQSS